MQLVHRILFTFTEKVQRKMHFVPFYAFFAQSELKMIHFHMKFSANLLF